jgi:hypothetical protein
MIKSYFVTGIVVAGFVSAWMGCSSNSGGGSGTGAGTTSSGTKAGSTSGTGAGTSSGTGANTSASSGAGAGTGTGGAAGTGGGTGGAGIPLECTVPSTPPSGGSCVTTVPENDAGTGIECNPVTNGSCAATDECDGDADSNGNSLGFVCFPGPNTATLCGACDNSAGPFCGGGMTCINEQCAKYCCTDADCGAGKCTTMDSEGSLFGPIAPALGICTTM